MHNNETAWPEKKKKKKKKKKKTRKEKPTIFCLCLCPLLSRIRICFSSPCLAVCDSNMVARLSPHAVCVCCSFQINHNFGILFVLLCSLVIASSVQRKATLLIHKPFKIV